MDKIKLIKSLIDMANELPNRDDEALDRLIKRARMIINNIYEKPAGYLNNLNDIHFYPYFGTDNERFSNEAWDSGKKEMLNLFNIMLEEFELFDKTKETNKVKKAELEFSNRIFIVHGHDGEMKQAVARTLDRLKLDPIILHEKPDKGRTIIEKITEYSDVNFAIALLSPDDYAYPKDQSPENAKLRARQNVIFELGFFIGKLGRERVLILFREEENFEWPSDYKGVLYKPYDSSGNWRFELAKELKDCGYDVDVNKLL